MDLDSIGKSIINEANPAGYDVRDSEQFSLIQEEYAKLTNPSATTPPDPAVIVRNATDLLSNKGKDITVAIYLVNGLMRQNGLAGLAKGLLILGDMIENFWESLYPPLARIRGRRNSIQWLIEQTSKQLETTTYEPQPIVVSDNLKKQIQRVDQLISARDEEAPGLFRLLSLIDAIPVLSEPEPTPTKPIETPNPSNDLAASDRQPSEEVAQNASLPPTTTLPPTPQSGHVVGLEMQAPKSVEETSQALSTCQKNLHEISDILLAADVSNPLPYRLIRTSAWFDVFELPPNTKLQTLIPPPKSQLRDMLSAAQGSQSWQSLVQICESNISNSIFWLDLHRLSDFGLSKVGASCEMARTEISYLVSNFVRRLPDVSTLKFNDGTPFADDATLQWLSGLNSTATMPASPQPALEADKALARALTNANALISEGDTNKALGIFSTFIQQTQSERLKLQCRVELCEFVLKIQPIVSAVPYAEAILETVEVHNLALWDPDLTVTALKSVYKAYIRTPSQATLAQNIISRLATLNPAAAYQVIQEAGI